MRVLYFGVYNSNYARNKVLINGLKENGHEIVECRERARAFWKYPKLVFKYLKIRGKFDIMIVGFCGQEVMFLARLLTRKPIIFDAFMSHYGGYIIDRGYFAKNSWRAKYYKFLDTWSCKLASIVLLDTQAHIDFFVKEFNLSRDKFRRIWIGADDSIFYPVLNGEDGKMKNHFSFSVLFFAGFAPLQGVKYIIKAAKILEKEDVVFNLVGAGQEKPEAISLAKTLGLKNIIFKDMATPSDLKGMIIEADACLGIFGDTPKTSLVIPNKVYESLAMRKPVITADTEAIRELFDEHDLLLVKSANPESLAAGIMRLKNNPSLRDSLAQSGHQKFVEFASPKVLGRELTKIIIEII